MRAARHALTGVLGVVVCAVTVRGDAIRSKELHRVSGVVHDR